jgi:carboxymethylenebutenolidase
MGPVYDLEHLWDMHCFYEFAERDVDATMATMVAQPYVNHVPTMTGGGGYTDLHRFYKNHFVNSNPDDTQLIPLSRTVGADRVVDELLFCFTHDREIEVGLLDASRLPVAGKSTADKVLDETLPSNDLMDKWATSAPQAAE